MTPFVTTANLEIDGVRHGFFGRDGGVSNGDYESLNTGPGSDDNPSHVAENRARCAAVLRVPPLNLLTGYQTHSPDVMTVSNAWEAGAAKVDALVTTKPGLAVGALAADCTPVLFCDPEARVVAAAHAGWRGALAGVLENTVGEMVRVGATAQNIRAAIGPCMRVQNFEVGLDLVDDFVSKYSQAESFFSPGVTDEKRQFDLVRFCAWRLGEVGVTQIADVKICTVAHPDQYFSYRISRRNGRADYGRNLSAIVISK